jgi:hypothetical protein
MNQMAASQYYEEVQQAYLAYYGRPADPEGLAYWAGQLNNAGGDLNSIINAFGTSAESTALYGGSNAAAQITAIYQTLFGRAPDAVGLNFYVNGIASGQFTLASVALNIYYGATGSDATELSAKLAYADAFTDAMSQSPSAQAAYSGTAAANNGRAAVAGVTDVASEATAVANLPTTLGNIGAGTTSFLTTGIDNVTGSTITADLTPFLFNGQGPTLNVGDTVTGSTGSTTNVLNLIDQYGQGVDILPSGVTISNIQTINLTTQGNAGANSDSTSGADNETFDVSGISGVKNVNVTSYGVGSDAVTAAATTDVNVASHNAKGVTVLGGNNVAVTAGAGAEVTVGAAGNADNLNPAGSVTVTESTQSRVGDGDITVYGGTSVNVSVTQATNDTSIQVGSKGTASVAGTAPTGDVTIADAGNGSITSYGGTSQTITSGGGSVTVGDSSTTDLTPVTSGAISVTDTAAVAYNDGSEVSGARHDVNVYGGSSVSVTTNTGSVHIGVESATAVAQNTTGDITVVDTATGNSGWDGAVHVHGGDNVSVTAAGGNVFVGGADAASNATGTVSVTETVATTSDTAGESEISIDGGNGVTVSAQGQNVAIGENAATTGSVNVTQRGVLTGAGIGDGAGAVIINGGTDVTVNTTGGDVIIGANTDDESAANPVTGAVSITDTFSGTQGGNTDIIGVAGGTTVNINIGATSGEIIVGQDAYASGPDAADVALNSAGTALANASQYATGDVTINNSVTNGSTTTYGTGEVSVYTNGAKNVSITGGVDATITDVESTVATGGANAGKAVGTSTLSNVTLDHVEGTVDITSDALTALTLLNGSSTTGSDVTINNSTAHDLALTLGGDAMASETDKVTDSTATSVTVTDNGIASGEVELKVNAATSVTVNTTAALTLDLNSDALTTVTVNSTAALTLDVSDDANLTSIDASASSGDVTVTIDPEQSSFKGGSGNDTVTITELDNETATGSNVIDGGTGVNTLVIDKQGSADSGAPTDLSFATNFTNLEIGSSFGGYFDATGFTGKLIIDGGGSAVDFEHVAAGTTLTILDDARVTYDLKKDTGHDSLSLTVGQDGAYGVGSHHVDATVYATGIENLNVDSEGFVPPAGHHNGNVVSINDSAATTITVTGNTDLTLILQNGDGGTPVLTPETSNVTTIDASASSGKVDVTGVVLSADGATITGGAGQLVASGVLTASGAVGTAQVNTVSFTADQYVAGDVVTETINGIAYSYTVKANDSTTAIAQGLADVINDAKIGVTASAASTGGSGSSFTLTANAPGAGFTSTASQTLVTDTGAISDSTAQQPAEGTEQLDLVTITGNYRAGDIVKVSLDGGTTSYATYTVAEGDTPADIAAGLASAVNAVDGALTAQSLGGNTFTVTEGNESDGETGTTGIPFNSSVSSTPATTGAISDGATTVNSSLGSAVDVITTGSGGGVITIGAGGSNGGTGSETINLSASTGVVDTLKVNGGTFAANNDVAGGVIGFQVTANASTSDTLTFETQNNASTLENVLANVASAQATVVTNLTYTAVNGVVSFSTLNGAKLSDFTAAQLIQAAEGIVTGTAHEVLAFVSGGNTYVVASDGHGIASVTELIGVSSVAGFGTTAAADTIVANVANVEAQGVVSSGTSHAAVFDDTGFSYAVIGTGHQVAGDVSTTLNNLAASAEVQFASGILSQTSVTTTQVGASGSNSLTLDFADATALKTLTVNGDNALTIHADAIGGSTIGSLVDATNTVASISITGTDGLTITNISDTALTSIDASHASNVQLGSAMSALTENNLSVELGGDSSVYANGAGNSFTLGHDGNDAVVSYGVNDTFVLGDVHADGSANGDGGSNVTAHGANNTFTINDHSSSTILADGANDTFTLAANAHADLTVGSNATITLGENAGASINVAGDVTGGTSTSFAFTTINGFGNNDTIRFDDAATMRGGDGLFATSQVNVATATSLANAFDLAVSQAGQVAAHTGTVDWFQYGGNTYVVEAVNNTNAAAAHTALGANDVVVKLTGLVDLSHVTAAAHTVGSIT